MKKPNRKERRRQEREKFITKPFTNRRVSFAFDVGDKVRMKKYTPEELRVLELFRDLTPHVTNIIGTIKNVYKFFTFKCYDVSFLLEDGTELIINATEFELIRA